MATLQSCVQLALEETPRYEAAVTTAPYRVATDITYLPITSVGYSPNVAFVDRADELRGIEGAVPSLVDGYAPAGSLAVRAYANPLTWLLCAGGYQCTYTAGGALVADPDTTTATGVNALDSATVNVASTSLFPATGTFILLGTAVTYTGTTATSFTGCSAHPATTGGEAITGHVPTGASKWVFTPRPFTTSAQQARSMQMLLNYVTDAVFVKAQGVGVGGLTLNSAGDMTADLLGLVYVRTADPNLTPAYDTQAIPFFRRGDLTLTWLAATGTTDDFSIAVANELVANRPLGQASYFPSELNPGDARLRLTGSIPKYRLAAADLDALLAGTTFAAKARWRSPKVIGATAYKYSMWVEMPACQYTGGAPADLTNSRRVGGSFDFTAAYDETAGYASKITLVNSITSIGAPFNPTNVAV
ncbi:MAG: hypothetical protein M3540_07285 [Actinomycetota bacterium]|nr:hypothetical protein [Actinomycetota bacterium]